MTEEFVENLYTDEIRSGFLVTSHRKKLWNVQIGLINEFARICKKHNLRWFAFYGTLLGAVRHKGFIPWDDDSDVIMFRPEYEKFKKIAAEEIQYPYFFDNWYEYHVETEEPLPEKLDPNYQYITAEELSKQNPLRWFTQWPSIRLRDSRTAFLEFPERKHINQGIFLDIFPFDPIPPFEDKNAVVNFVTACELMTATAAPNQIYNAKSQNVKFLLKDNILQNFLKLPYRDRGRILEENLLKNFFESQYVGGLHNFCIVNRPRKYELRDFEDVVYLPFEKIEIPAPIGYERSLTAEYGDWHKLVYTHQHAKYWSADIPYTEWSEISWTRN